MKIALLGYGKMGHVIEKIALQRGHEIVLRKSIEDTFDGLENAENNLCRFCERLSNQDKHDP